MAKLTKTLKLPSKLVELVKTHWKTDNASKAIRSCVEFAILDCLENLATANNLMINHSLSVAERRMTKTSWAVSGIIECNPLSDKSFKPLEKYGRKV